MIRFLLPVVILLVFTFRVHGQISGTLDNSFYTSASFGPNIPEIDKSLLYPVRCIPATEGRFYVMGSFDHFSGHPTKGLARVFADGTVDTAFQVDFYEARFEELWPLKSGKILVRGSFTEHEGGTTKGITRLLSNGKTDPGFSFSLSIPSLHAIPYVDDSQVFASSYLPFSQRQTVRLDSNGSVDSSFAPIPLLLNQIEIQPNGLFIGGDEWGLYRFNSSGGLDTSFHQFTRQTSNKFIWKMVPDGSGSIWFADKVVFWGSNFAKSTLTLLSANGNPILTLPPSATPKLKYPALIPYGNSGEMAFTYVDSLHQNVIRLQPNGQVVNDFHLKLPQGRDLVPDIFIQDSGWARFGYFIDSVPNFTNAVLIRYDSTGEETIRRRASGFNGSVSKVFTQKDGKIIAVGSFTTFDSFRSPYIIRLLPDGQPDPGFLSPFPEMQEENKVPIIENVSFTATGKILLHRILYGYNINGHKSRLVMLQPNGSIDNSFDLDTNGISIMNWDGACLMPNQKIYVKLDTWKTRIFRFNTDGSRDLSFTPKSYGFIHSVTGQVDSLFTGLHQGYADHLLIESSFASTGTDTPDPGDTSTFVPKQIQAILKLNSDGTRDTAFKRFPTWGSSISKLVENQQGMVFASTTVNSPWSGSFHGLIRFFPDGKPDTLFTNQSIQTQQYLRYSSPILPTYGNNTLIFTSNLKLENYCQDGFRQSGFQSPVFSGGSVSSLAMADSTHFYAAGLFNHVGDVPVHSLVKLHYQNCLFTDVQPQLVSSKKPLVFPNPGSSEVHVQFPYSGNWQTRVFDAQGKPTETKGNGEELSVLQTRQLPAGLYYIRIWDGKSSFLVPWMKQ
jgi:uncharacterized delta-60 repeat protein